MIKELILAIILGAFLGLGVMGGYLTLNKKNVAQKTPTVEISPTPISDNIVSITPTPQKTSNDQITIDSPENNSVISVSKTDFTGITKPNSTIIITTASNSFNGKSDNTGKFDISVDLDSGVNLIKVTAIDPNDNQTEIPLMVTYSTAKF